MVKRALNDFISNDLARMLLAVLLMAGTLALLLAGKTVPETLWILDGGAIGFYFGVDAARNTGSAHSGD